MGNIEELCGEKATIYSLYVGDDQNTQFDNFIERYEISHKSEIKYIWEVLKVISTQIGYRESFFKQKEAFPGSQIEAIYDKPKSKLRLFCINLGRNIIIIGDGGCKPKNIKAWQESEELSEANYFLQRVSKDLQKKIQSKEITYSSDYMELLGDLTFGEEYE